VPPTDHGRALYVEGDSFRPSKPRLWSAGRYQSRGPNWMFDHRDGHSLCPCAPEHGETGAKQDDLTFLLNLFDEVRRVVPVGP
jgi:hypothetical protein